MGQALSVTCYWIILIIYDDDDMIILFFFPILLSFIFYGLFYLFIYFIYEECMGAEEAPKGRID